jgi:DNA replication protein DnaC
MDGAIPIGKISEQHSGRAEDSGAVTATNTRKSTYTAEEARAAGLEFCHEPPKSETCEFCGKTLCAEGMAIMAKSILFWRIPRCDCSGATEKWTAYDEAEERRRADEEHERRQTVMRDRIKGLIGKSGIKARFQQRTFDNFICDTPERKRCYKTAKEYADNFRFYKARGDGLYIEGPNGTGKTHLAAAVALQLIGEGVPVICKTSSDLLNDIKKTFDSDNINEHAALDIYKKADLLIIDDLGKEQCTDWSMSMLYSIINDRYEDMKPTIVTTNHNANDLTRALTPKGFDNTKIVAIISRLREVSKVVTMAWTDIRSLKTGGRPQ